MKPLNVRRLWTTIRPGLAPELTRFCGAPWLSRTAGRPIWRPERDAMLATRIGLAIRDVSRAFTSLLNPMAGAVVAFQKFGECLDEYRLQAARQRRAAAEARKRSQ